MVHVVQSVPPVPTVMAVPARVQAKPVRVKVPTLKVPPERVIVEPAPVMETVWPDASRVPPETVMLAEDVPETETVPPAVNVPEDTLIFGDVPPDRDTVLLEVSVPPFTTRLDDAPERVKVCAPVSHDPEVTTKAVELDLLEVKLSAWVHVAPDGAFTAIGVVHVTSDEVTVSPVLPANVTCAVPPIVIAEDKVMEP